jgi:hypothetical protein
MNYPIPRNPEELTNLTQRPVDTELIAAAIAGFIGIARSEGRSLDEVRNEVLTDHQLLDPELREMLSEIVARAWETLPSVDGYWSPPVVSDLPNLSDGDRPE